MSAPGIGGAHHRSGVQSRVGRVLVVDDEPLIGRAVSLLLSKAHQVDVATRARDALERLLSGDRYDVILCDISMPEMSGIDFQDEVARVLPEQAERIVFVTGGIPDAATRMRVDASARMVLEKPVAPDHLRALVAEHVERGRPAQGVGA